MKRDGNAVALLGLCHYANKMMQASLLCINVIFPLHILLMCSVFTIFVARKDIGLIE